jgi:hypothetical protein
MEAKHEGRQAADKPTLTGVGPRQIAVLFLRSGTGWAKFLQKIGKGSQKVGSGRKAERQYFIKIK